jgi:hypothetical protein
MEIKEEIKSMQVDGEEETLAQLRLDFPEYYKQIGNKNVGM